MIFSEIALEGVKCFREQCRFTPRQGYNLVWGPNESGKSTILECMTVLLDPLKQLSESESYQSWGPPGNSRAGLMITQGDRSYRLTRDFVNGLVGLSAYNPQTKKFDVIAQDHAQVDSILRERLQIPAVGLYRKLFIFDKSDMPSGRPKLIVKKVAAATPAQPVADAGFGAPGPAPGAMPAAPAAPLGYGMKPEEIKQQIDSLKEQLEKATKSDKVQYEIDELESNLFDIENKTREIKSNEKKIEQLETSLKSLQSFSDLPPDIVKRIEFFEEAQRDHNIRTNDIDNRLGKTKMEFNTLNSREDFFKEQNFLIGVGCFIAGIIVHVVGVPRVPALKILPPIMILAGLGFVFWVLWNEFSKRIKEGELKGQLEKVQEEKREEEKKFEVEGSVIRRLMEEAGVEESKELGKKLKEYQKRKQAIEDLNEKTAQMKKDSNFNRLETDRKEIQDKIEKLNKDLQTSGGAGFSQDPADIQRQIDSLQFTLDNPGAPPPPGAASFTPGQPQVPMPPVPGMGAPAPNPSPMAGGMDAGAGMGAGYAGGGDGDYLGGGGMDYGMDASSPGLPASGPDPDRTMVTGGQTDGDSEGEGSDNMVDDLWTAAEKISGMDRSTMIMQMKDRFNVYVQAFTGKKYNEGDLSSEKNISLRSATGSYTDLKDLTPSTQDAAWLAFKLSLIEILYQKVKFPVILDDPLRNLDDSRLAMVSKALKRLGAACQVILLSTQRAHSKVADNTLNLVSG